MHIWYPHGLNPRNQAWMPLSRMLASSLTKVIAGNVHRGLLPSIYDALEVGSL